MIVLLLLLLLGLNRQNLINKLIEMDSMIIIKSFFSSSMAKSFYNELNTIRLQNSAYSLNAVVSVIDSSLTVSNELLLQLLPNCALKPDILTTALKLFQMRDETLVAGYNTKHRGKQQHQYNELKRTIFLGPEFFFGLKDKMENSTSADAIQLIRQHISVGRKYIRRLFMIVSSGGCSDNWKLVFVDLEKRKTLFLDPFFDCTINSSISPESINLMEEITPYISLILQATDMTTNVTPPVVTQLHDSWIKCALEKDCLFRPPRSVSNVGIYVLISILLYVHDCPLCFMESDCSNFRINLAHWIKQCRLPLFIESGG